MKWKKPSSSTSSSHCLLFARTPAAAQNSPNQRYAGVAIRRWGRREVWRQRDPTRFRREIARRRGRGPVHTRHKGCEDVCRSDLGVRSKFRKTSLLCRSGRCVSTMCPALSCILPSPLAEHISLSFSSFSSPSSFLEKYDDEKVRHKRSPQPFAPFDYPGLHKLSNRRQLYV